MKVIQIGSLFYLAIVEIDRISIVSIGYPTYEQCVSMTRAYEV